MKGLSLDRGIGNLLMMEAKAEWRDTDARE